MDQVTDVLLGLAFAIRCSFLLQKFPPPTYLQAGGMISKYDDLSISR
jgi:hypothetical protein